ncbi:motility associated factor glycosyltransferase family protein [Paenibacillus sp. GCM10027628]|uniref:motility associated factor glycosyltransferase family protein n=1 Tax=Paenibacillus sp. GCM10027628 TaxID=3273413 RepID=UPI00362BF03F
MSWYEHNIQILKEQSRYAYLYHQLEQIEQHEEFDWYKSFIDESEESHKSEAINSIQNAIDLDEIKRSKSIVILGFGLGYVPEELLNFVSDQALIIVLESNLPLLKAAFHLKDLSKVLSYGRLAIISSENDRLEASITKFILSNYFFVTNRILFIENDLINQRDLNYLALLRTSFVNARLSFQGKMGNSPEDTIIGNIQNAVNIHETLSTYPFEELLGKFKGVPAICVAAGPSLAKNMNLLKELKDKALIFACDTIVEKLQKEGIIPHFVSSLERGIEVYNYFYKDKQFDPSIIFIGLSLLYPKIFEEYPGPKMVVARKGLSFESFLKMSIPYLAQIEAGKSVAHLNFALAHALGCDPIILIGQDLAFGEDGHTHAKGTYDENEAFLSTNQSTMVPNELTYMVDGYYGEQVRTNNLWSIFREWFEQKILEVDVKCINSTEGGAYIKGAEHISLKEAAERYCINEIDTFLLDSIRNYKCDSELKQNTGKTLYEQTKIMDEIIDNMIEEFDKMIDTLQGYQISNLWSKNRAMVAESFRSIYAEYLNILLKDQSLLNMIQYGLFTTVSRINRVEVIETGEQFTKISNDLIELMNYSKKYANELKKTYEVLLNQLG